jgi:hypothetical protein
MPNWVYNSMSVSGSKETIAEFKELASRKAPTGMESDGTLTYDEKPEVLSFWNFIEPEDKAVYFGASDYKPAEYEGWSMEERLAYSMKFSSDGWYDWNVRNWGTKWDAGSVDLGSETETTLNYTFDTAWSIPEPVFEAMVKKFPTLDFDFSSEEEQGWGAEYTSSDGEEDGEERSLIMTSEWDIPDCHEDYASRGRDCWACDSGDEEELYEDCPRKETAFQIIVNQVMTITATSAESAWEIANGVLEDFANSELPDKVELSDKTSAWVEENGVRVYPTLTEVA